MPDTPADQTEIRRVARDFILSECLRGEDASSLKGDTALITGGILDSISTARLVSFLEARYGIRFKPHEVSGDRLESLDRIVETVQNKLKIKDS